MNILNYKKTILSEFDKSKQLAQKLKFASAADIISGISDEFLKKEIMIVTVGEMKRGKSSLLNAMIGDEIFPVNINVCTNIVTVLRYGNSEKAEVVIEEKKANGYELVTKPISRSEIPEYVSEQGNAANHKNVKLLNIEIPSNLLKDGVVFVDTPGVGSLNVSHAETTYGFLPNADLLLFVSDCVNGLTETELNFLKKGYKYCKNVLFPLTKKDLNHNYAEIAEDNKRKISDAIGVSENEITIIPLSSTAKQRAAATGSEIMLKNSNFTEFEKAITSTIAEKRFEITVLPFLNSVKEEMYKISDSITAQYQVMSTDKEKLPELRKKLEREIENYNSNKNGSASWKKDLNNYFAFLQTENNADMERIRLDASAILSDRVKELGVKICETENYEKVYEEINGFISEKLLEMKEKMLSDTAKKMAEINSALNLDVNSYRDALNDMKFTPKPDIEIKFPERKFSDKLMTGGRKIGMGMMGGSKIGMLAGGIFGIGLAIVAGPAAIAATAGLTVAEAVIGVTVGAGMIGTGVGSVLGGAKGCVDAACTGHDVDIPVVNSAFQSHINASMITLREIISKGFISLKNAVTDEFDNRITSKAKELAESIEHIKELIKSTESDAVKINNLTQFSGLVTAQIKALETFEENASADSDSGKADSDNSDSGNTESDTNGDSATGYSFL